MRLPPLLAKVLPPVRQVVPLQHCPVRLMGQLVWVALWKLGMNAVLLVKNIEWLLSLEQCETDNLLLNK